MMILFAMSLSHGKASRSFDKKDCVCAMNECVSEKEKERERERERERVRVCQ
jgi:hypothetical protein